MRLRRKSIQGALTVVTLSIGTGGAIRSAHALCPTGAQCPAGVTWGVTTTPGERIYQCIGDMSTPSHEGVSDAANIQDALFHASVAEELPLLAPATVPAVRTVTLVPAANGQPCNMKAPNVNQAGTVLLARYAGDVPANGFIGGVWLRGQVKSGVEPAVLKFDADASFLDCSMFMGNAKANITRVLSTPAGTALGQVTVSDLVLDGAAPRIQERFSESTCPPPTPGAQGYMAYEGGHVLFMSDVHDSSIDHVVSRYGNGDGIYIYGAATGWSTNVAVTRSTVSNNSRVGINLDSLVWGQLRENSASGNQYLVKTENAPPNIGYSLWVDNQSVEGLSLMPAEAQPTPRGSDYVIARNRVALADGNFANPLEVANVKGVVLASNSTRGGVSGVAISRGAQNIVVHRNVVRDIPDFGSAQIFNQAWAFPMGGSNDGSYAVNQNFLFAENELNNVAQGLFVNQNNQSGTVRGLSFVGNALRGIAAGPPAGPIPLYGAWLKSVSELLIAGNQMSGFHVGIQLTHWNRFPCPTCDTPLIRNAVITDNLVRGALAGNTQSYGLAIDHDDGVPAPNSGLPVVEASPHGLVLTGNNLQPGPTDPCFAPLATSSAQTVNVIPSLSQGAPNGLEMGWNAGLFGPVSGGALQNCGLLSAPVRAGAHARRSVTGTFTVAAGQQSAVVTLPAAETDDQYNVAISMSGSTGTPPSGATLIRSVSKQANQFTASLDASTGTSTVTFNWMVIR